jgi:outer membrane receptor protein involved in Fe transport
MQKHPNRRAKAPALTQIAALIATSSFAAMMAGPAYAQSTQPATDAKSDASAQTDKAEKGDAVGLNRLVITGTSQRRSKMRSSVSVTDVDQQQILDFSPRSEAEVLHLIPGVRAESSAGPGGNSNISVRGLPLADGGAKYVQLQEDGLPTVAFGDMNFANNDYWIRYDYNIDRIQTVRGGSASTAASHAPGAVINFISKTGETQGGTVGLTRGLDFNETRFDGSYGGKLAPDLRFHIGGYFRDGEGPRDTNTNSLHGYQIKGNLTKTFNGGKGFFRVNFKALDEHAPTYTSMPAFGVKSGDTVGSFTALPGYDIRTASQYSPFVSSMPTVGPVGTAVGSSSLQNGITVNAKALGFEFENDLGGGLMANNKFRYNSHSGAFQTTFASYNTLADILGGFAAGSVAVYANGPKAGQVVTTANLANGLISTGPGINTQTPNANHWVNDLSLSKKIDNITARGGLYMSSQTVKQVWQISPLFQEVGTQGALIDINSAAGAALTTMGMNGFNNNWGDCCARQVNATFNTTAPYAALSAEVGDFDLDASVRYDKLKATGTMAFGTAANRAVDVNGNGVIDGAEGRVMLVDTANARALNYSVGATSYSFGGNYRLSPELSAFLRTSKGARITADRVDVGVVDANGKIKAGASNRFLGEVTQHELGVKNRGDLMGVQYGVFATLFRSNTSEYSYDQTRIQRGLDPIVVDKFKATGLELESAFSIEAFAINLNATYTDMKNSAGFTPHAQPKWMYTIAPRYTIGPVTVGATLVGKTKSPNGDTPADGYYDGHMIINGFASMEVTDNVVVSVNATNLANKIASSGQVGTTSTPGLYNFRPETGRAISASLKYKF